MRETRKDRHLFKGVRTTKRVVGGENLHPMRSDIIGKATQKTTRTIRHKKTIKNPAEN